MEDYAEELRTPPVTLVSLVGCPELHQGISAYLHTQQPPINTLALPDFSKISVMAKVQKETLDSSSSSSSSSSSPARPVGILKRDWLLKHRTRIPAVVAALFTSNQISGDPAQWLQVCTDLENLKVVIRGRNIKLVVVVVQSSLKESADEVNEDRIIALRKRAEVDSKYVLNFIQYEASEQMESFNRIGSIFSELANTYYRDEGRRVKTRIEKKLVSSVELIISCCFKVAVYAEFRRDWVEALKFYEEAYHTLREAIGASTRLLPLQRLIEIKTVAELLHFKVSTLLLHGGKIVEAMTWFNKHIACYKKLVGAPELVFIHWEWVSRQFLVFAELLETSSAGTSLPSGTSEKNPTEWELHPAYYYQLAAQYLREKRCTLELALSASEVSGAKSSAESVIPSVYVGQFAQLLEQGEAYAMQPLTDADYILYALAEGKRFHFQDSFEIIALFKKSSESYKALKAARMALYCENLMGIEYFSIGDFSNAKQQFNGVASLYRREGWVALLWEVLGYLRECSRRLNLVKDFTEYSLEMAALPISSGASPSEWKEGEYGPAGSASYSQQEIIHKEVFGLAKGECVVSSKESSSNLEVREDQPLYLEIDPISPLRVVLLAAVAFHEQVVKPGTSTLITVSLLSQLPQNVEIDQLEIQFNQSECNFIIASAKEPLVDATSSGPPGPRIEAVPTLTLVTNKWLRLTYSITCDQTGKLECLSVIAKMGPCFTVLCRAESPASMDDLPLWKFEDHVESLPTKDPALALSGQKVIQVEEQDPQVDLSLGVSGPALVGESFIIPVTVSPKGHAVCSGELKINLVDARGGGLMSPRASELSTVSHHVQLLSILGPNDDDEPPEDPDSIKNIQQSFGLLSVPHINIGDTWSCKLEIKWHKPKPIMLYVSLGYMLNENDASEQKIHVHKSLQIEGKTAVTMGHRFMFPFRRDPLLLTKIKAMPDNDQSTSLAFNETSILLVNAKNCTDIPLRLMSMSIEVDEEDIGRSCTVQQGSRCLIGHPLLVPGEEFKQVLSIVPEVHSKKLSVGTVCLRWRRDSGQEQSGTHAAQGVVTRHKLPDVNVEFVPLVVSVECPPHAILGDPFTCYIRIQNQTQLLQEIKYSLADSQSFVLSGSRNDTIYVLPKSEHILGYKFVPLASGSQQLPKITVTSVRYSAGLHPSSTAATFFVFPSKPQLEMERQIENEPSSVAVK